MNTSQKWQNSVGVFTFYSHFLIWLFGNCLQPKQSNAAPTVQLSDEHRANYGRFFSDVVVHSKKQIVLCQQRNGHWWSHWCEYTSFAIAKQIYQYNICIRAQTSKRLNEKIWTSCVQFDGSHTFFITLHFYLFNIFVCIFFVIAPIFPWKEPSLHM